MWCPNDKSGFFTELNGQITPYGRVGKTLIKYIKNDLQNIVEIGTWNGLGSTRCFLLGLQNNTNLPYGLNDGSIIGQNTSYSYVWSNNSITSSILESY